MGHSAPWMNLAWAGKEQFHLMCSSVGVVDNNPHFIWPSLFPSVPLCSSLDSSHSSRSDGEGQLSYEAAEASVGGGWGGGHQGQRFAQEAAERAGRCHGGQRGPHSGSQLPQESPQVPWKSIVKKNSHLLYLGSLTALFSEHGTTLSQRIQRSKILQSVLSSRHFLELLHWQWIGGRSFYLKVDSTPQL